MKVSTNTALETNGKEENRTGKVQAKIGEIKNAVGKQIGVSCDDRPVWLLT